MKWSRIIDVKEQATYLEILEKIAESLLVKKNVPDYDLGIMGGKSGVAIFLFLYANY